MYVKLLPLGTVIKIKNCKACIIGYSTTMRESKTICGYFLVSYPIGFTNIDKAVFVPADEQFEVLAEGYSTMISSKVLDMIADGIESLKDVSREDLIRFNQRYKEIMLSKREDSEG